VDKPAGLDRAQLEPYCGRGAEGPTADIYVRGLEAGPKEAAQKVDDLFDLARKPLERVPIRVPPLFPLSESGCWRGRIRT
jgi:hypothetical protein